MEYRIALGLDVAKKSIDVCLLVPGQKPSKSQFENSKDGFKRLLTWLHGLDRDAIHACLEPTGVYSKALAQFLHREHVRVSQVNSFAVQCHGRSKNFRSKTDRIDAYLLADYCLKENPPAWEPPSPVQAQIREINHRLVSLDEMIQQEKNRLEAAESEIIRKDLKDSICSLTVRRDMLEEEARKLVQTDPIVAGNFKIIKSISGIGDKTALRLLALVQFERFENGRQVAAFAGLTPRDFESGSSIRKKTRISRIGNSELRSAMFFPAMVAVQFNPQLREFADRLKANNKPPKVVLCAVSRKLLVLVMTLIKKQEFYDPHYRSPLMT